MIHSVVHQPHMQHMNQSHVQMVPPTQPQATATIGGHHHMPHMSQQQQQQQKVQQQQQQQQQPIPHLNMSSQPMPQQMNNYMANLPQQTPKQKPQMQQSQTQLSLNAPVNNNDNQSQKATQGPLTQLPSHMMHNNNQQQSYHPNRPNQHSHHPQQQQRSNYGQNRSNYHNSGHHSVQHSNHTSNSIGVAPISGGGGGKNSSANPQQQQQYQFNNAPNYNNYIKHAYGTQSDSMNQQLAQQPQLHQSQQQQQQQQTQEIAKNTIVVDHQASHHQQATNHHQANYEESKVDDAKIVTLLGHGCSDASSNGSVNKTAMCLINELVRANQLKHQYRVTHESGPSHDKLYTVVLELGDERYSATHKTIKGAQQMTAADALLKTNHKQQRVNRMTRGVQSRHSRDKFAPPGNTITPTVQLNALAMKRGIPTEYSFQYPKSYNEQFALKSNYTNIGRNTTRRTQMFQHNGGGGDLKGNNLFYRDNRFNNNNINSGSNRTGGSFKHRTTDDDPYTVTVTLGDRKFVGIGLTLQSAKHDAASKALATFQSDEPTKGSTASSPLENGSLELPFDAAAAAVAADLAQDSNTNGVDRLKSAISVVQEIAQKRDMPIRFVVENESGPAHMKHFVIKCSIGEIETTGEGNSKKVAKKHAAENILIELKKLPPLRQPIENPHQKATGRRNNNRLAKRGVVPTSKRPSSLVQNGSILPRRKPVNLVKEVNTSTQADTSDETELTNPVSRLLRVQQAAKKHDPIYSVVEERGQHRKKEFVMEVNCSGAMARGTANSKKQAKRLAATNLLILLGYADESENHDAGAENQNVNSADDKMRKVTFGEPQVLNAGQMNVTQSVGGSAGRQLVPGLLLMKGPESKTFKNPVETGISHTTTATIAKELLDAGTSATAEAIIKLNSPVKQQKVASTIDEPVKTSESSVPSSNELRSNNNINNNNGVSNATTEAPVQQPSYDRGIRAVDQLRYLAALLKFEVQFNDFPKGTHNDYLTLVSLNTDPPQIFHGTGNSSDASKDQAALCALKALSELGLDNVNKSKQDQQPPKSILSNGKTN